VLWRTGSRGSNSACTNPAYPSARAVIRSVRTDALPIAPSLCWLNEVAASLLHRLAEGPSQLEVVPYRT